MDHARTREDRSAAARRPWAWLGAAILLIAGAAAAEGAEPTRLAELRTSVTDERSRLVFDLAAPAEHTVFTLSDPHRIVIDIEDVEPATELAGEVAGSARIEGIRSATRDGDDLRVVLDLSGPARPRSFLLEPAGPYGHRLVVDVLPPDGTAVTEDGARNGALRDLVIAIDPGHGGRDPGALGPNGTREEDVTLQIARRLRDLLAEAPGFRAVLTREGDDYLSLRERIARARRAQADMFVSIHADAFRNEHARGSSVYALSVNGASSEAARWLAERENSADLIGGISLDDKDETVASVLLDLSQTATIESSLAVGEQVLGQLGEVNRLHKRTVQQAGFAVLKSPDIPSILVETAFISNPTEAAQLRSGAHQQRLARAIRDGLRRYFERRAPPGTHVYARNRASSG